MSREALPTNNPSNPSIFDKLEIFSALIPPPYNTLHFFSVTLFISPRKSIKPSLEIVSDLPINSFGCPMWHYNQLVQIIQLKKLQAKVQAKMQE